MLQREACERRVYRLATLLTGNPVAAAQVIAQVVDVQPDLIHLDGAHMDRLTVLRSREIPAAMIADSGVPTDVAAAVAGLPGQQREAWVFSRVYRLEEREMARAMDCSFTATKRHMEAADAGMRERLGQRSDSAAAEMLAYSMTLDVPVFYRRQQLRRRRLRAVLIASAIILVALGLIVVALIRPWSG